MEQGFQVLLQVFGGLALFLYGTDSLCRAVQQGAGRRLRSLLARCTANPAGRTADRCCGNGGAAKQLGGHGYGHCLSGGGAVAAAAGGAGGIRGK